jgi:hypothetical protein
MLVKYNYVDKKVAYKQLIFILLMSIGILGPNEIDGIAALQLLK